jgi:hypothetical protein
MEDFEDELPDEAYELLAKLLPMHPAIAASGFRWKKQMLFAIRFRGRI